MKRYKFRLEKLLELRIQKEEESVRDFKDAQVKKIQNEEKLSGLKDKKNEYSCRKNQGNIIDRKIMENYLRALERDINLAVVDLKDSENFLEEKRQELNDKRVERKTVEILKEKQKMSFLKEQERIEQITNDEFALYAHLRHAEGR